MSSRNHIQKYRKHKRHQDRHLPAPLGKFDVDVAEVRFEALAGIVGGGTLVTSLG